MVITSSTRNRVGGNTPRGFESHLLRQNNSHPFGWLLFFCSEGGIRKAALRNMPVACFNRRGFSAEKESHRPDLSARFIRRDVRLLAECRWHSATAVAFPQKRNPTHTTRLQDSLDHPAGEFLIMGGGRSLYCEAVNPTHSASEHRCAHILPFRKRSSQC